MGQSIPKKLREAAKRPLYALYERRMAAELDLAALPRHIGVIHDGHRRYAREERLPDYRASYQVGMAKVVELIRWTGEFDIPAVTCWLLSKENLQRPAAELDPYYDVLVELFDAIPEAVGDLSIEVRFVGSIDLLPERLRDAAVRLRTACAEGDLRVTIALAYAGRQEIVDAAKELVAGLAAQGVTASELPEHIDADALAKHMYTADLPDPDLVIRTSGEARLSGFLLWQSAYAEYLFVDVFWPAFRRVDFLRALRSFTRRERRFGK